MKKKASLCRSVDGYEGCNWTTAFSVNHPSIMGTSVILDHGVLEASGAAKFSSECHVMWKGGGFEVIDGNSGMTQEGAMSRVSTAELLKIHKSVTGEAGTIEALKQATPLFAEKHSLMLSHPLLKTWLRKRDNAKNEGLTQR